jgi:RHS repeat-associated protein
MHLLRLILLTFTLGLSLVPSDAIAAKGAFSEKPLNCSETAQLGQSEPFADEVATTNLSPFGEVIRASGPIARLNPFLFSTKYYDWETELLHYPGRSYSPRWGRWLSRDPIGEEGGLNLYALVGNNPINDYDPLGLSGNLIDTQAATGTGAGIAGSSSAQAISVLKQVRNAIDAYNEIQEISSEVLESFGDEEGFEELYGAFSDMSRASLTMGLTGGHSKSTKKGQRARDLQRGR